MQGVEETPRTYTESSAEAREYRSGCLPLGPESFRFWVGTGLPPGQHSCK